MPLGAAVEYVPISKKDKDRVHKFSTKLPSRIFMGHQQRAGGSWSGDLYVSDTEEIENAEHVSDMYLNRFNHKEVHVVKVDGKFIFPCEEV